MCHQVLPGSRSTITYNCARSLTNRLLTPCWAILLGAVAEVCINASDLQLGRRDFMLFVELMVKGVYGVGATAMLKPDA